MKQNTNITDDQIIESYNRHHCLSKIACELKVPHITVFRRCQRLNLTFHQREKRKRIDLQEVLEGKHPHYSAGHIKRRLIKEKIIEYRCSICGINEWNGNHLILQLDHINGDPTDHRKENLRLLCPNCHSQTDTFCGKNSKVK